MKYEIRSQKSETGIPKSEIEDGLPKAAQARSALPDGWRWVRLEDLAETCSGTTPSRERADYYGGNIPWVKTGELIDEAILNSEEHVTETALRETSLNLLPKDTLLIAMYGQGQTRGRTSLLSVPATINQACFAILPKPTAFDSVFLQYWFRHSYGRLRKETEGRGGNQPNLNGNVLRKQLVPLPAMSEQKRLVVILQEQMAAVEQARAAAQAQLEATDALAAAYLRAAFNSSDGQQWPAMRLGDVCSISMGQSPDGASYNSTAEGEPLLNGPTEFGPVYPTAVQWTNAPTRFCQADDILLCVRGNTTGRKNVADRRYCIGRGLAAVRGNPEKATTKFIWFALDIVTARILSESSGSTFPNLPGDKLESIKIRLPNLVEQQRIADQLQSQINKAECIRQSSTAQLETIERLPAALLRRAFNGEL